MNDLCKKKERNTRDRTRKNIIIVVSEDTSKTKRDIAGILEIDTSRTVLQVINTKLKSKHLQKAITDYIKDNSICVEKGDRLIYLDEKKEGGDVYDCRTTEQ